MRATLNESDERLLSLTDVLGRVPISKPTLARIIRSGDLTVVRIGGRTFVAPTDLREFIDLRRERGSRHPRRGGP